MACNHTRKGFGVAALGGGALGVALEGGLVGNHAGVGPQRRGGVRTVVRGITVRPRGHSFACV
eukprot:340036-Prymnesium_polylepis.1